MRRAAAALVALALLAGCGYERSAITSGGRVLGDNLTVYSTLPEPQRGIGLDMVDAQKLALMQRGGRAGDFGINFVSVGAGPIDRDAPPTRQRRRRRPGDPRHADGRGRSARCARTARAPSCRCSTPPGSCS